MGVDAGDGLDSSVVDEAQLDCSCRGAIRDHRSWTEVFGSHDGDMRPALIAVAGLAAVALGWVTWVLAAAELTVTPGFESDPDFTVVIVVGCAAVVMAFAAGGLIARRAEGAFLLSVGAFMLLMPLALLAFLTLMAGASPYDTNDPGPIRLLGPGLLALDVTVAVLALRLGRRMRDEAATRNDAGR